MTVVPHGAIPVAQVYVDHFRNAGSQAWSGLALPVGDGCTFVIYNDSHPLNRIRTTLLEEFFHLWLGHPPSVVRYYSDIAARDHNAQIETEAYGSGAAALVPYKALRERLQAQESVARIAAHFEVSRELVLFRAKVGKLYRFVPRRRVR